MHVPPASAGGTKQWGTGFLSAVVQTPVLFRLRFKLRRNRKRGGRDGGSAGARGRRARVRVGGGGTVMSDGTCPCDSTANTDSRLESGRWEPLVARDVPSNPQRQNLQDKSIFSPNKAHVDFKQWQCTCETQCPRPSTALG